LNNGAMPVEIHRRGLLLVLSSPSGAGKSTLARRLLESDPDMTMSVSVTTRKMRPGEVDGTDYHFITQERFEEMRDNADLLESATVFGNGYGTPRQPVDDCLAQGKDVLFDIDWQGTQQIVDKLPNDLVRVFILPPSAEELRERLIRRAQDPLSVVAGRMAEAAKEISHYAEYDYVLINDDLERCFEELRSILRAERLKRHRRAGLSDFVNSMQEKL